MRKSLADNDCPMARAADQVGDGWVFLILWAAHNGVHRFDDLQKELGVARNILADRLKRMVKLGLLEKKPIHEGGRRLEYRVTEKSIEFRQVLVLVQEWGRRWCPLETEVVKDKTNDTEDVNTTRTRQNAKNKPTKHSNTRTYRQASA